MQIATIADIQKLVVDGFQDWRDFGHVYTKEKDGLILFNYLNEAQYEGTWTFLERVSRGLIVDKISGEVVARPFDKFFNWNENNRTTNAPIKTITEKLDGSLGILYRDNGFKIATRGSFDSEQAQWATNWLNTHYFETFPDLTAYYNDYTLLFEIIYPKNRIVVDYEDNADLFLIAARNRFTGRYLSYSELLRMNESFNFPMPKLYNFADLSDILANISILSHNNEGWVVEFEY